MKCNFFPISCDHIYYAWRAVTARAIKTCYQVSKTVAAISHETAKEQFNVLCAHNFKGYFCDSPDRVPSFLVLVEGISYLIWPLHEPVDGATVDDGREHAETRPESFSQRRHAQHDVDVGPHAVDVLLLEY